LKLIEREMGHFNIPPFSQILGGACAQWQREGEGGEGGRGGGTMAGNWERSEGVPVGRTMPKTREKERGDAPTLQVDTWPAAPGPEE